MGNKDFNIQEEKNQKNTEYNAEVVENNKSGITADKITQITSGALVYIKNCSMQELDKLLEYNFKEKEKIIDLVNNLKDLPDDKLERIIQFAEKRLEKSDENYNKIIDNNNKRDIFYGLALFGLLLFIYNHNK